MFSTESPRLNDVLPELDFDGEQAPSNGGGRLKPARPYRSSGFKNAQFRSERPSIGRRLTQSCSLYPSGFHWRRRHACVAILWWRDGEGLGSIARLVGTRRPARP